MKDPTTEPSQASSAGPSPFSGLRVIDASNMVMVPSAAVVMADFGADVIKLEPPTGDLNRRGHMIPGMPVHQEQYCFLQDNRNKRSVSLDLKSDAGLQVLKRLLESADVFFTNTRKPALDRLGLDYDTLKQSNPRLIFAHGTGYGDHGSEHMKPGFDAVCYWSRSGIESTIFPEEGELGPIPYGSGDHPSGMTLLAAVLIALLERHRTGRGQRVSTSLLANGAWANAITLQAQLIGAEFQERRPRENPRNFAAIYYRAKCGRPFKFTIIDHAATWPKFCAALGRPELAQDPKFATMEARQECMGEVVRIADMEFAKQDLPYWLARFAEHDIAFSALPTFDEIGNDQQMRDNGIFLEIDHPRLGSCFSIDNPVRLETAERQRPVAAPDLGQHSEEVLLELGYSSNQIDDMIESGVLISSNRRR